MEFMNLIGKSFILGLLTSLFYLPDIYFLSYSKIQAIKAYSIQSLHDAICVYFLFLYTSSMFHMDHYVKVNALYAIIICLFSIYKRCILTVIYNSIMELPSCSRYIPIWQRFLNGYENETTVCFHDSMFSTHVWLKDHILQSSMMILLNCRWIFFPKMNVRLPF